MNIPKNRQECEQLFKAASKVRIVFTKKNGDERAMICTRNNDLIPAMKVPKRPGPDVIAKPPSETSFPVFDLEKQDWRAFTIANLLSVEAA